MFKRLVRAAVLVVCGAFSFGASALDLGLTPNHAFGLWININQGILAYAANLSRDQEWLWYLEQLAPREFEGKIPADVLALAEIAHDRLKQLPIKGPHLMHENLLAREILAAPAYQDDLTTPTSVYLLSGDVLVEVSYAVVAAPGARTPTSSFFAPVSAQGIIPDDVFALADLAVRRLDAIIARAEAGLQFRDHAP